MSSSEWRRDPLSGAWTIIAPGRGERPNAFISPRTRSGDASSEICPFCLGNETKTPPEVFAIREPGTSPDSPGWRVRVVPNKFPALTRGGPPKSRVRGLFESRDGFGVHEVIIDSPGHDRELADLPADRVREALDVYVRRIRSLETEDQCRYIQLFKNKGEEAGASLSHPHSQVVAMPIIPKRIEEEIRRGERFRRETGACFFCRLLEDEMSDGARVVAANDRFVAYVPFAARFPYELRIHPRRHTARISGIGDDEIAGLADILKTVFGRLKAVLSDPPYNLVLHQAPYSKTALKSRSELNLFFHWYFEVIPVLTRVAGFEWGTGFHINPVSPEVAASSLR